MKTIHFVILSALLIVLACASPEVKVQEATDARDITLITDDVMRQLQALDSIEQINFIEGTDTTSVRKLR